MGIFGVHIGAIPFLEIFQRVMHRLAAFRLPPTVTTIEFFMGGGSQGWASMSGYSSL